MIGSQDALGFLFHLNRPFVLHLTNASQHVIFGRLLDGGHELLPSGLTRQIGQGFKFGHGFDFKFGQALLGSFNLFEVGIHLRLFIFNF